MNNLLQNKHYYTIETTSTGLFKDKGSKFLSFAYPVQSEIEIKEIVDQLRKKYYDARHHCYAFVLGADRLTHRANDDREPSGTAGKPILGQIHSANLTNILIVVVRYFGGTLLGTSGLANAYKQASIEAIANAKIVEKTLKNLYQISFGFTTLNDVMKIIKDHQLIMSNEIFENNCSMEIQINTFEKEIILEKINKIDGLTLKYLRTE